MLLSTLTVLHLSLVAPQFNAANEIRELARPLVDAQIVPGLVVNWIAADGQIGSLGLGHFSSEDNRNPDGQTIFEIGSISKTFTALALALEVERGNLNLDTSLNALLPEHCQIPRYEQPVRLIDLATHTAGFPNIPGSVESEITRHLVDYSGFGLPELNSFLRGFECLTDPGQSYLYSNAGFGILGWALARKSNQSTEQFLLDRIRSPLQLLETQFQVAEQSAHRFAPGHDLNGDAVPRTDYGSLLACAGLTSTAEDMTRYLQVLLNPHVTENEELRAAIVNTTQIHFEVEKRFGVGLAWHFPVEQSYFFHDGRTDGYSSYIFVDRAHQTAGLVLANGSSERIPELGQRLRQLLNGEEVQAPQFQVPLKLKPEQLRLYAGQYRSSLGFRMVVSHREGRLYSQLVRQPALRLFGVSPNRFLLPDRETEIGFELAEGGEAASTLVLTKDGRNTKYSRID